MGYCSEHGWYQDLTTAPSGCPQVHVTLNVDPHDEERCEFCRAINEAKRHHYATLIPRVTVSNGSAP